MKLSLDRAFRVIWLVVGALLLLFLLVGGVMVLSQVVGNWGASDDAVRVVSKSQPPREEPRAVRYTGPQAIRGTTTRLVTVENGRAYEPGGGGHASGERFTSPMVANVIFLDAQGARLLLDRPAYVRSIDFPRGEEDIQRWVEYRIAFQDSNRDGKLDARDETSLYITDLEGRNLRQVLGSPHRLHGTQAMDATHMLVYALEPRAAGERGDEDRMRQRAFIYDVASARLSPYAALDSATMRAGQILAR